MRSSVSIALFVLLSAFFLFALLAALQHSGKALGISLGCLAGLVVIVIFLTPVRLPGLPEWLHLSGQETTTTVTGVTTTTFTGVTTSTTFKWPMTNTGRAASTTTTGAGQ